MGKNKGELSSQIIAERSRDLLNYQLSVIDSNHSKSGTLLSICSLFIPLSFSVFKSLESNKIWFFFFSITILLNFIGLVCFLMCLINRNYQSGINPNLYDELVEKKVEDIYLFEIGINRDSFNHNKNIINSQTNDLRWGLNCIVIAAALFTMLSLINLVYC